MRKLFKKIILPFQVVLLNRHLCPGCTRNLDDSKVRRSLPNDNVIVSCKCRRRYVYDTATKQYRRATREEERTAFSQ